MSKPNSLVCTMLTDVDVLGAFTATNDVVSPLDASCVVIEQRSCQELARSVTWQEPKSSNHWFVTESRSQVASVVAVDAE